MALNDTATEKKYALLQEKMAGYVKGGAIIAFSGGVDSALLLKLACMAADRPEKVLAVTVGTKLHPMRDVAKAAQAAARMGAGHRVLRIDELAETGIENNPVDRCYLCKRGIFRKIKALAKELAIPIILEGTNEDDLHQYRPGIKALRELDIISPLAECRLTKREIRKLAESLGVPAADRPSSPCLATRLPYGTRIEYGLLEKIDRGEIYLRKLGFYNVRLRVHDSLVRIEVDKEDLQKALSCREEIIAAIKELGFCYVTLDLEGFQSGSMDKNR